MSIQEQFEHEESRRRFISDEFMRLFQAGHVTILGLTWTDLRRVHSFLCEMRVR